MKTPELTPDAKGGSLRRLVQILVEQPGMTAAAAGNALWAKRGQGDLVPSRFARPAGKLLLQGERTGVLYKCFNVDRRQNVWYARNLNDSTLPTPAQNHTPH